MLPRINTLSMIIICSIPAFDNYDLTHDLYSFAASKKVYFHFKLLIIIQDFFYNKIL